MNLRVLEYITGKGELSYTRLGKIFSFYEAQRVVFGAEFGDCEEGKVKLTPES